MSQLHGIQLIIFVMTAGFFTASVCMADVEQPVANAVPQLDFLGEQQELAMHKVADRDLVQVYIGAAGPYAFLIDTGASVSVVDTQIASQLGLEVIDNLSIGAPGGDQIASDVVSIPELRVNGLTITGSTPVVFSIAQMTAGIMQGVLGMDLFAQVLLSIDPNRGIATVSRDSLELDSPGVIEFDNSQGRMTFDIAVAGRYVPMQIDTGSPGSFTLPAGLQNELPTDAASERKATVQLVGSQREITTLQLDGSITFAGFHFKNPDVSFMHPSPHIGNIGQKILSNMVITVDHRNSLMAFQPVTPIKNKIVTAQVVQPSDNPRRLGIRFGGGPGLSLANVSDVASDSLGEQAGFRAGDTILSLNGTPMQDIGVAQLGEIIRGQEQLSFVVDRQGDKVHIEID